MAEVQVRRSIAALRRYSDEARVEIKKLNADAAKIVELRAKQLVPVQSGALKKSIRSSGQLAKGVVRAGNKNVPYSNPIHWGWKRPVRKWSKGRVGGGPITANRFLTDALDDERADVTKLFHDEFDRLSRKYS